MAQITLKAGDTISQGGKAEVVSSLSKSVQAVTKTNLAKVVTPTKTIDINEYDTVLSHITSDGKATYVVGK